MSSTSKLMQSHSVQSQSRLRQAAFGTALMISVSVALVAYADSASAQGFHRAQYEVYEEPAAQADQQAASREQQSSGQQLSNDQQTVANEQTPQELQSANSQPEPPTSEQHNPSNEQSVTQGEQAAAPPQSRPEQQNAFVSGESNEEQTVAQTDPRPAQPSEQSAPQSEQTVSQPSEQSQQSAQPSESDSGEEQNNQ